MSSGDTARPAPDVEGLLRAWLQTQECKERGLHLLRADDFQGVCDGHLVEARLKAAKALAREMNAPAPPRERRSAAERSNRFVRGASPGTGRARLEIARRRREATLLVEQLRKIGPRAALAARPAWPVARESPSSITGASAAENTAPRRRHFVRMHSETEQLDVEICQDDTSPCSTPARPSRPAAVWPAGATFPWPLSRESPSSMSRAKEAIARRRHEASRLCEELRKKMDPIPN